MKTCELLKFVLTKSRLSQAEIAKRMHVTEVSVHRWVNGEREPKYDFVVKFCNACGFTLIKALTEFEKYYGSGNLEDDKDNVPSVKSIPRDYVFVFGKTDSGEEYIRRYIRNEDNTRCTSEVLITKEAFLECYNRWIKEK